MDVLLLLLALATAAPSTPRVPLRVGLIKFQYPPWVKVHNGAFATTDADYIGGFFVDFYRELGHVGNFDVTLVPIEDNNYLNDFTGVTMKLLDAGEIDLAFDTVQVRFRYQVRLVEE